VDSTDERNMMNIMTSLGIRNGTNGPAWFIVAAEERAMGTMESGPVAK
jgi:hypothetical protein